jgi:hypothetical protein
MLFLFLQNWQILLLRSIQSRYEHVRCTHTHKNTRYMDTRSLRASIVCDPERKTLLIGRLILGAIGRILSRHASPTWQHKRGPHHLIFPLLIPSTSSFLVLVASRKRASLPCPPPSVSAAPTHATRSSGHAGFSPWGFFIHRITSPPPSRPHPP